MTCEDSVDTNSALVINGAIYTENFDGGEQFGNLQLLCTELQERIRRSTGCDQWGVRWSHGQDITTNIHELSDDEWQERMDD